MEDPRNLREIPGVSPVEVGGVDALLVLFGARGVGGLGLRGMGEDLLRMMGCRVRGIVWFRVKDLFLVMLFLYGFSS